MQFLKFITIIITIMLSSFIRAASIEDYINQLPAGANLGLIVQKVGSNKPIIDFHSQKMALPASTQKLITALVALLQLGPNFRFITTFEIKGNLNDGILKGNLVVRFGGDPTFKRQDLHNMVILLKKHGIKKILGNIIIDTSIFANYNKPSSWLCSDIIQCFGTPPSAAIIDRNCFSVSLYSAQKPNDLAFVRVASSYPITILSHVRTLAKGSIDAYYCELDISLDKMNRYIINGCLSQRTNPIPLTLAIQDGANYAGNILKNELKDIGISYNGVLLYQTQINQPGSIIVSKKSLPLYDLLKIMLKKSDNMIADILFLTIGHNYFGIPGTWRAGSDAIKKIIRQKTNINLDNSIVVDGSGLSRHNLISPSTMMEILQYIARHDSKLNFISMLPIAGYDGSLKYRKSLHIAGVDGKVFAKTGSLKGVYNLAGFINTKNKNKVAFVQYLSGYIVRSNNQKNNRLPLIRFESRLYRYIYKYN